MAGSTPRDDVHAAAFGVGAVIVAATAGQSAAGCELLWEPLVGRPLLAWCVGKAEHVAELRQIVLVVTVARLPAACRLARLEGWRHTIIVASDSPRGSHVLRVGLEALDAACAGALVLDAARPLVTFGLIRAAIAAARPDRGAVAVQPIHETIKRVADGRVSATVPRERLVYAQTPQLFPRAALLAATRAPLAAAHEDAVTLAAASGIPFVTFAGDAANMRVATRADLAVAAALGPAQRA